MVSPSWRGHSPKCTVDQLVGISPFWSSDAQWDSTIQNQPGQNADSRMSVISRPRSDELPASRLFIYNFDTRRAGSSICLNKIPTQRNVKPVSLLAFHGEFVRLRDVVASRRIPDAKADQLSTINYLSRRSLGVGGSARWNYSFTTSICLSITCPVKRSMATCTQ